MLFTMFLWWSWWWRELAARILQSQSEVAQRSVKLRIGHAGAQDCMVGLLFAFMPVLAGSRGGGGDQLEVLRLLVKCAALPDELHTVRMHPPCLREGCSGGRASIIKQGGRSLLCVHRAPVSLRADMRPGRADCVDVTRAFPGS